MIRIKLFPGGHLPKQATDSEHRIKGDWLDACSRVNISYSAGELVKIPLGFACQLPQGHEALLASRSSTFKNTGLLQVNAPGVIDESFCGDGDEWCFLGYATRDGAVEAGQRIAQFRVQAKMIPEPFEVVEMLGNEDRGGFGSTGR